MFKKFNFFELFLYVLAIICFCLILGNLYGLLDNLATIMFPTLPDPTDTYYTRNDTVWVYRSLVKQIPMLIISSFGFYKSLKIARNERKEITEAKKQLESK